MSVNHLTNLYPWQWPKRVAVIGVSVLIVMGVSWWLYTHGLPAGLASRFSLQENSLKDTANR